MTAMDSVPPSCCRHDTSVMDSKTPVPMEVTLTLQDTSVRMTEGPWTEDEGKQTVLAGKCYQSIQVISHELVTDQEHV